METGIDIFEADLDNADHQRAIIDMTAAYALDPMGNSGPLPDDVLARLIPGLKSLPTSLVFLAYAGDRPVGIATCFRGFSSFMGQPLINIHDLALLPDFRGRGIGPRLLQAVERKARELGMRNLREDGIRKALAGLTTAAEVIEITVGDTD